MDPKQLSEKLHQGKNPHLTDRPRRNPLLPITMGIKLVLDGVTHVELAREEWSENKAFCEYCRRCDGLLDRVPSTRSAGGCYRCWHTPGTP